MQVWNDAFDDLHEIDNAGMTVDQKLKRAEVMALLAIGQVLSQIHHSGINPEYDSGSGD